eukprot:5988402-Pyramimonas_sp.AAC.1
MDQFPTRHAAILPHLIRTTAAKYYSREGLRPHWRRRAQKDRLQLLRQRAEARERGHTYTSRMLCRFKPDCGNIRSG